MSANANDNPNPAAFRGPFPLALTIDDCWTLPPAKRLQTVNDVKSVNPDLRPLAPNL